MYFHPDNQRLLYETLQKSPFFMEFAGQKEQWFRSSSEQFYKSERTNDDENPHSLLEINKKALRFMIADLKRILGYHDQPVPISVYNVSLEKTSREDKWTNEFSSYQEEYNRLLAPPIRPETAFASEKDERIKNMDELLAEQQKRRTMEYAELMPPAPKEPSSSFSGASRLKILDDIDRVQIEQSVNTKEVRFSENIEEYATA